MEPKENRVARVICAALVCALAAAGIFGAAGHAGMWMGPEAEQRILQGFAAEISYVEERHGVSIERIDGDSLEWIKKEAVAHLEDPSFRFAELMDEIAVARAQYTAAEGR